MPRSTEDWPPKDSDIVSAPVVTGFGDFVWCSAVAWICTRDLDFTTEIHQQIAGSEMSLGAALALLDKRLATRKTPAGKRVATETALERDLRDGIIAATSTEPRGALPLSSWRFGERLDDRRHDDLFDFACDVVTAGVRISERNVLRRYKPSRARRLTRLGGAEWSKSATVYWVKHGDHRGFTQGAAIALRQETMEWITEALRSGSLACQAEMRRGTPGVAARDLSMRPRDKAFWAGLGLADAEEALFDAAAVMKKWPGNYVTVAREGPDKATAARRLEEEFGMSKRDSLKTAKIYAPDGRSTAGVAQQSVDENNTSSGEF